MVGILNCVLNVHLCSVPHNLSINQQINWTGLVVVGMMNNQMDTQINQSGPPMFSPLPAPAGNGGNVEQSNSYINHSINQVHLRFLSLPYQALVVVGMLNNQRVTQINQIRSTYVFSASRTRRVVMVMLNYQTVTTINQSIHLRFLSFPHKAGGGGNVELHLGLLDCGLDDCVALVNVRLAHKVQVLHDRETVSETICNNQCCGSKYIEFGSGS